MVELGQNFRIDQRYYASSYGRFNTADPKGGNGNDPGTLNKYAYVGGDPVNANDPQGLCAVLLGGITQNYAGDASNQQNFADNVGAISAFGYAGGSVVGGVLNVIAQGLGIPTGATYNALQAIALAAQSSGPISIFAFSGGAQAFTTAWGYLTPEVQARIQNITYIDPGAAGSITGGNGANVTIYDDASSLANIAVQAPINEPLSATFINTGACGHNSECVYGNYAASLQQNAGAPCSVGAGAVFGAPGNPPVRPTISTAYFGWLAGVNVIDPVPVVTSTITFY